MDEITLAILPRVSDLDINPDVEHASVSSNESLPTILDEADTEPAVPSGNPDNAATRELTPARMILDDMHFLAMLGQGSSGKVALIQMKKSRELYACKTLRKEFVIENDEQESVRRKKRILLMLGTEPKHPLLCHLIATFQTETRLYFVMDYFSGGDLLFHLQNGQFSIQQAM
jgi:serine/threonine protein kinase